MNSSIYKLLLWVFQVAATIKVVALDTLLGLEPKPQVQAPTKQTAFFQVVYQSAIDSWGASGLVCCKILFGSKLQTKPMLVQPRATVSFLLNKQFDNSLIIFF